MLKYDPQRRPLSATGQYSQGITNYPPNYRMFVKRSTLQGADLSLLLKDLGSSFKISSSFQNTYPGVSLISLCSQCLCSPAVELSYLWTTREDRYIHSLQWTTLSTHILSGPSHTDSGLATWLDLACDASRGLKGTWKLGLVLLEAALESSAIR